MNTTVKIRDFLYKYILQPVLMFDIEDKLKLLVYILNYNVLKTKNINK